MLPSNTILQRLEQIERELNKALAEYPSERTVDRVKFARAMVRFLGNQLEVDDEATVPVLTEVAQPRSKAS